MKIELRHIPVREVVEGYINDAEEGVTGYGGRLDIRPRYQREFIYKDKQRDAVIRTVQRGFPLNVLYWVRSGADNYEVLDGQQRLISLCEYVRGGFALDYRFFHNLTDDEANQLLNYELMVYFCDGTDSEKLEWFRTINIAGEKLTEQELRNATYSGPWLDDAKRIFSKTAGPATKAGGDIYLTGTPIRQDYLETVLRWHSGGNIEAYMAERQHWPTANELWRYFQNVISWTQSTFPNYRRELKGAPLGELFNQFQSQRLDPAQLEDEIVELMQDEDVTKKSGVYAYVLTRDPRHLSIRTFSEKQKREAYERQEGVCPKCGQHFQFQVMEADHITPWHEGGHTTPDNCQLLCKADNRRKAGK